jgi:hypothetical protein
MHGFCAALSGYAVAADQMIWVMIGLALEVILGLLMASMLGRASDAGSVDTYNSPAYPPVDFSDSEEFASFAESSGSEAGTWDQAADQAQDTDQAQDADRDQNADADTGRESAPVSDTVPGFDTDPGFDTGSDTGTDPVYDAEQDSGQSMDGDGYEYMDRAKDNGPLLIPPRKSDKR